MSRPRVILDCDGVLADFVTALMPIINRVTGGSYTADQVTRFDFAAALGLSREQSAKVKRAIGESCGWCASIPIYPDAIEGVRRLQEIADVYVVTSPWNSCPTWMYEREQWLERHFGIKHANIVHASAKYLCVADVFVDDKTEAVARWSAAHPQGRAVRWTNAHNRLDGWGGFATSDWRDVHDIATSLRLYPPGGTL